ncbi:MAG TPA: amidohydrolase family protein [Thermoanaerobaculia bacterium]|nr:amidohydrolase family protein [Thermoanaerobaculia bacterium]
MNNPCRNSHVFGVRCLGTAFVPDRRLRVVASPKRDVRRNGMQIKPAVVVSFAISILCAQLFAQSVIPNNPGKRGTVAIRNATIHPVTSAPIANGTIVFSNGVITAVGAGVAIPAGAAVIDGSGLSVYPGMIDSGTTVGLTEIDSGAGTVDVAELGELNPNARAEVAINPHSNVIPVTRVNGITTVLSAPQGGLISGQSALIHLAGWTPKEMVLKAPVAMHIQFPRIRTGGFGDQPQDEEAEKEARKRYTSDIDRLRDVIRDARAYATRAAAKSRDSAVRRFDRDLILEALVPVVEGRVPVVMHANVERDIRAAIKFADEMKLKMILAGGHDVGRVLPELKARDIAVILGPIHSLPQREDDPYDIVFTNAKTLHDQGIRFSIQTADAHNARNLPYQAAACAAFGLPKDVALKAVTLFPAQIFGVADKIGSLETGKIANLIVTNGDPLEIVTNVSRVFINGEDIPMESHHTLLYKKFRDRP